MTKKIYYKEIVPQMQGIIQPLFLDTWITEDDPVWSFNEILDKVDLRKFRKKDPMDRNGRPAYDYESMMKTVLFGFMDMGYISLRELERKCRQDIRYMYLMQYEKPSFMTFSNFINDNLTDSIEEIFKAINEEIFKADNVDLEHIYIDGTKLEANANKYSWVWKKRTEKSRYRLFDKISVLLGEILNVEPQLNTDIRINTEYHPQQLSIYLGILKEKLHINERSFKYGRGHHKSREQRWYERLSGYIEKLKEYVEKIRITGDDRNSYSKTDHDATFMRVKEDYMRNDRLLPAYNIQCAVADEYIAVRRVEQYRSDMDCFIPLMKEFRSIYGHYPRYPVADAGYGSYNNYIFCEENGMEKYMKYPMYRKETEDENYLNDPFRAVNFGRDSDGELICPNGKRMIFSYRKAVRGNRYGRQEEIYRCEDCSGCPYADRCKKGDGNRTINLNEELTGYHREVLSNLNSIQGALLRMNRSIQAEGTFGVIKYDRDYDRIVRRGLKSVKLEILLISIGFNLYKYHNKRHRVQEAA